MTPANEKCDTCGRDTTSAEHFEDCGLVPAPPVGVLLPPDAEVVGLAVPVHGDHVCSNPNCPCRESNPKPVGREGSETRRVRVHYAKSGWARPFICFAADDGIHVEYVDAAALDAALAKIQRLEAREGADIEYAKGLQQKLDAALRELESLKKMVPGSVVMTLESIVKRAEQAEAKQRDLQRRLEETVAHARARSHEWNAACDGCHPRAFLAANRREGK